MPLPQSAELFYGKILTEEQLIYANSCYDGIFTGCQARAGSGKTTIAIGVAKLLLHHKKEELKSVHYIFPTVQEKALGYSPGDIKEKEAKYLNPLRDALLEIGEFPDRAIKSLFNEKLGSWWVDAYSHNYMRGGNIKNSVVIIDEAQNLTRKELRTILTRIHDSCHVILMGDINQCDIDPKKSGFADYYNHYGTKDYALVCSLTKNFRGRISSDAEEVKSL